MMDLSELKRWHEEREVAFVAKRKASAELRLQTRLARGRWKDRELRMFVSPGAVAEGKARPTAPGKDKPLSTVNFVAGKQLVFSDGSFRSIGRRRFTVEKSGHSVKLSGRQFRMLRKRTRHVMKTAAQNSDVAVGTSSAV